VWKVIIFQSFEITSLETYQKYNLSLWLENLSGRGPPQFLEFLTDEGGEIIYVFQFIHPLKPRILFLVPNESPSITLIKNHACDKTSIGWSAPKNINGILDHYAVYWRKSRNQHNVQIELNLNHRNKIKCEMDRSKFEWRISGR